MCQYLLSTTIWLNGIGDLQTGWPALSDRPCWHRRISMWKERGETHNM
jgi:hypothetical protein